MAQQGERKEGIKREGRKAKRGEGGREEEVGGGQRYSSQPRSSIRRVMWSCHSHGRMRTYRA